MTDREKVIKGLEQFKADFKPFCGNSSDWARVDNALALLKEQSDVVLCKDCENWIPGYITDKDDFIPPKCGKYKQMVGHSAYDYCNLAERKEGM